MPCAKTCVHGWRTRPGPCESFDLGRIRDIRAAVAAIHEHDAAGPDSGLVFDAVRMRLIEIGEESTAYPPNLLATEPTIPWRGWYDHAYSGVHNPSNTAETATPPGPQDLLTGVGMCGDATTGAPLAGQNGRCGHGPRLPLLIISPYARRNVIDHTLTNQSSILKFVEDNWKLPCAAECSRRARMRGRVDGIGAGRWRGRPGRTDR